MFRADFFATAALSGIILTGTAFSESPPISPEDIRRVDEAQPIIGFQSARHDFGEVEKGEVLTHDFYFLNNGTADLIIEEVSSRTSGITVAWSKKPVPPNEVGFVRIGLDTAVVTEADMIRIYLRSNAANGDSILYVNAVLSDPSSETD